VAKYFPVARVWSLIEAAVAALLLFLPVSQAQTAAILGLVALATGEKVVRKVSTS